MCLYDINALGKLYTKPKLTSSLSFEAAAEVNVALGVTLLFFLMMEAPPPTTVETAVILALLLPECGLFLPLMAGGLGFILDGDLLLLFGFFGRFDAKSFAQMPDSQAQIAKWRTLDLLIKIKAHCQGPIKNLCKRSVIFYGALL